jgi:ribonuclease P protein component
LNAGESRPAQQSVAVQFGAGVATKNFKKAVDRNRVKRLIKEAWRLQKNSLHAKLKEQKLQVSVFIIYTGKDLPLFKEVYDKTAAILDKLDSMATSKK